MIRMKLSYAAALAFVAGAVLACSSGINEDADSTTGAATSTVNLCVGQAGNTFHCLDDTRFELCTGFQNGFVIESCPAHLCATRHPPSENPCVGAALAQQIDGVPPTPPGQPSEGGASASSSSGSTSASGSTSTGSSSSGSSSSSSGSSSGGSTSSGNTGTNSGSTCVGGPKFDPAGAKNVGNGHGEQFIGGQCLDTADCASGCCAFPCGICSGPGAQFQAGKEGCGFGG